MSQLAKEELLAIDLDVTEILNDYGSNEIYVKPFVRATEDDVYNELSFVEYAEPIQVKGFAKFKDQEETNLGLGRKADDTVYTIKIQKSSYPNDLTRRDLIVYKDVEYDILSINVSGVLGDDILFYVLELKRHHAL